MIKRYILHIEFHWGYRPRISIKRVPAPGEQVFDGGEWGTLRACPECGGVGLLHVVEPKQYMAGQPESLWPQGALEAPWPKDVEWDGNTRFDIPPVRESMTPRDNERLTELLLGPGSLEYSVGEIVTYNKAEHRVEVFEREKRLILWKLRDLD